MASPDFKPLLKQVLNSHGLTSEQQPRRVGIELEFAGLEGEQIVKIVHDHFNGNVDTASPFEIFIRDTEYGDFRIELDSKAIKKIGEESSRTSNDSGDFSERQFSELQDDLIDTIGSAASTLVPWEIVAPPIPLGDLHKLFPMIDKLREAGALGTKHSIVYAFGVHLNPELPNLEASTIVNYLKSFMCVYDYIRETEKTDIARRITPYINHFDSSYQSLVLAPDYQPNMDQLIDDYLQHNPTRNRSLDMLPLFKEIDKQRVLAAIDDDRINARPTLHYRLPNCEIDDPEWNLDQSLEGWMRVEILAHNSELRDVCDEFLALGNRVLPSTVSQWTKRVEQLTQPSS